MKAIDALEITRAMKILLAPGRLVEVRALEATISGYGRPRTIFGYFDDPLKLAAAVKGIASAKGIYFTPNPVNPALLARAQNRLKDAGKSEATSDGDITARRWLLVDCDPARPAGISSTDVEHEAAIDRACSIKSELSRMGWPEPIIADSGNGGHLLYRVDLVANDGGLIERCLDALAALHGDDSIKVDRGVHNPARIWKLYGTWACKGDSTAERPHRLAKIMDAPAVVEVVTLVQLEALAALAPAKESPAPSRRVAGGTGDVGQWLDGFISSNAGRLPPMKGPEAYQGGRKWVFEVCPWNSEHKNESAFLIQRGDGVIQAGCHHNGCISESWRTLRAMIEPAAPAAFKSNGTAPAASPRAPIAPAIPFVAFPVEVLPSALADLVSAGAKALGCDSSQIALPAMAACSCAIGNSRRIALKASWSEPAVVWAVTVLPSGALKSPALDLALEPIRRVQGEAIRDYKEKMVRHDADVEEWEKKDKRTRKDKPPAPVCARIAVNDITVEGLASLLARQESLRGLICERDELSGWLKSFNQYKSKGGADEAHWLTIFGARSLTSDRKTGDERMIYVPRAFVSLTGTIQPGVLRRALLPEYRESGLLARLLLAMPPVKRRKWSEATVHESVRRAYEVMLAGLLAIPMGGALLDPEPVDLPLDSEAKALWVTFYNAHNAAAQATKGGDISAAWSKLEGYAARFGLIVHCVRIVSEGANSDAVDAVSMAAGVALARWFGGEAERVYSMLGGDDAAEDENTALVRFISERGGRITARELSRASRRYRADGAARDALCKLVEAGNGRWVEVAPGEQGGRPVSVFEVVTQPPALEGGDTGDGDETPGGAIRNGGYGTVTTVTGVRGQGYGTGGNAPVEDDREWADGNPDTGLVEAMQ